jgi:hypothetical protein
MAGAEFPLTELTTTRTMNRKQKIFKVAVIAIAIASAARLTNLAVNSVNPHIDLLEQKAEMLLTEDDDEAPL